MDPQWWWRRWRRRQPLIDCAEAGRHMGFPARLQRLKGRHHPGCTSQQPQGQPADLSDHPAPSSTPIRGWGEESWSVYTTQASCVRGWVGSAQKFRSITDDRPAISSYCEIDLISCPVRSSCDKSHWPRSGLILIGPTQCWVSFTPWT